MTNSAGRELFFESPTTASQLRGAVLPEQLFTRMLCVERKRSERSGRLLILFLLESATLLKSDQSPVMDKILLSLARSTRDTDIVGWYREQSVLGVLFTEIGAAKNSIVDILSSKVLRELHNAVTVQQFEELELSFHVFPDDCVGGPDQRAFSVFYPDLIHKIDSQRGPLFVKRCIDLVGSLFLIIVLLPVFLILAAAIKLTSRGPVLFRQKRLGQFEKQFTFLKFRSMYQKTNYSIHEEYVKRFISNRCDASEDENARKIYKIKDDPRVTRVGGFLRRTSLDEVPQLFNVLTGQMSLVGPRPPLPYEFESYEVWHRRRLLAVKPGITGSWQVEGRSRVKFDDMVRMDLEYARDWSLCLDFKILLRTPRAVVSRSGAY